jgi:hypothetical protein
MYEDTEGAVVLPHADGDELALDDSQLYPPGPSVAFDGDGVTASLIPCL